MCVDTMIAEYIEYNRKEDSREESVDLSLDQQVSLLPSSSSLHCYGFLNSFRGMIVIAFHLYAPINCARA